MSLHGQFVRELARAPLQVRPPLEKLVGADEVAYLPATVQRYLRFMGVIGRPRIWSFQVATTGRLRTAPDQAAWMKCHSWQYDSAHDVARVCHLRVRAKGVVPIIGRDTYLNGHGRMLVKSFKFFTLADAAGPEFDLGELVTWLNDAILFAPSMLLGSATLWTAVDESSFDVSFTDQGQSVTARVLVDERGAPRDFSTLDRFFQPPEDPHGRLKRTLWTTPVDGWQPANGRQIPTQARAVWHLASGEFDYVELRPLPRTLAFNVPPGKKH
jgi:hypothetical protein